MSRDAVLIMVADGAGAVLKYVSRCGVVAAQRGQREAHD